MHRLLGRTYHAPGARRTRPSTAYRRAIEVNDLDAWSMNNLGLLLLEAQRADEALPLFAKAVERAAERAGVPQQPRHGARAHGALPSAAATAYKGR